MKLVCEKMIGEKFAMPEGEVVVDEKGMIEVKNEDIAKALKEMGFEEVKASKKEVKKEEPKEIKKEEVKEIKK